MKILVMGMTLENNLALAKEQLRKRGLLIDEAEDAEDALSILDLNDAYGYEACVFHSNLPDDFCRMVRGKKIHVPLICITGLDDPKMIVHQLKSGCDQVIRVPTTIDEIEAFIMATIRRSRQITSPVLEWGRLTIDYGERMVYVDGEHVHLTNKEFRILEVVSMRQGNCVACESILEQVYDMEEDRDPKIVDVFICKLNKKIRPIVGYNIVQTVWGRGRFLAKGGDHAEVRQA